MEMQAIVNLTIGLLIAIGGWFAKSLWDAVSRLKDDLHAIEVELPSHYLRKDEFGDAMRQLNEKLDRIADKLDQKADR